MSEQQPGEVAAEEQPRTDVAPGQPAGAAPGQTGPVAQGQPDPAAPGQGTAAVPGQPGAAAPTLPRQHVLRRTRTGGVWVALTASAVVLLLLLIFILENQQRADIGFFGAHVSLPVGVGMLLAAVAGALVVIIPGTGRIIQLRATARRHRKLDASSAAATPQPPAVQQAPPTT